MFLIRVSGLFYESKLLGTEYISDPKCLGEDIWIYKRFRIENQRRKVGEPV